MARYIGKSKRKPSYRWGKDGSGYLRCTKGHEKADQRHFANAIKKYGWDNFIHEILFRGLTADEAAQKEKELIAEFESYNPAKGYNMTLGGEGCAGRVMEQETRDKLKESLKKYKHIYQYDKKGNYIKEWKDCEEILNFYKARGNSNLYSHLYGRQKSFMGYIFKLEKEEGVKYEIKTTAKKIRCYSRDGRYIKTYYSYQEAFKETGAHPSMIVRCLRNECVSSGGFVWRENVGSYNDIIVPRRYEKNFSAVLQIDDSGDVVAEYESIKEARKQTGISDISAACRGARKKAGWYFWKYKFEKEEKKERKWNKNTCFKEAVKYSTIKEFNKNSHGAYNVACVNGWIKDYPWLVDGRSANAEKMRKWTYDTCYELALNCYTRGELKSKNNAAYNVARKNDWLKDYNWFVDGHKKTWEKKRKWTKESCYQEALMFSSRSEFQKNSNSAYNVAWKNNWLKNYTWFISKVRTSKSNDPNQLELKFG